jgi:hypothetical protein
LKDFRPHWRVPQIDHNAWGYAIRTACASCLALYISFSLNLDESHWAFTTCYIVGGQRLQGKILAKSLARIVGTLVGAIASFVLVNAFAQHGVLFVTWFAAWLSLCAILSYSRRDDWAYAWVLSGYTTAIVGIPAALTPQSAFEIIASRGENILIGILCMAGVGMIASTEFVGPRVTKLVKSMDKDLSDLLSSCLSLTAAPQELTKAVKELASSAASIEDLRFGLGLEETGAGLTAAKIEPFQLASLELASCALNLEVFLFSSRHFPERPEPPAIIRALKIGRQTVSDLFEPDGSSSDEDRFGLVNRQINYLDALCAFVEEQGRLGFPAIIELAGVIKIRCLLAASQRYVEARSALFSPKPSRPSQACINAPFDSHAAAIAGVRVFVAVGVAAVFWVITAWPSGDQCLVWAGLASCRYSITPDPARATQATFKGMIFAALPTYLLTFYVLPQMDGFAMLVLALLPVIVVGVGIGISLGRAGEVGAAMLIMGSGINPSNEMQYDAVAFFNGVLATIVGVGVVCLTHFITFPTDRAWKRRIAERSLIQRIAQALQKPRMVPIGYLGWVVRSLHDFLLLSGDIGEGNRDRAATLIRLFALGYEVTNLKRSGEDMPAELSAYSHRLVSAVTHFFEQPSPLQLSVVRTLSEQTSSCCERFLTRSDVDPLYRDQIAAAMAGSLVIGQTIDQQKNFFVSTSQRTKHLSKLGQS